MGDRTSRYRDRQQLHERLLTELAEAAKQRHQREDLVDTETGPEPTWVGYERDRMLAVVNAERDARGRGPLDIARVATAEHLAAGHVDYATKYALYCAELAVDTP